MAFKNAFLFVLSVFVMTAALLPFGAAWAQKAESVNDDDLYELVLQVARDSKTVLSRAVLGFQRGYDQYYLPVGDLTALLKIKADIDLENGTVKGWYLSESYPYEIDAVNNFYIIRGERVDFAPGDVFVREMGAGFGDIYVRYEILNQILPLELELDFSKLRLLVNTEKILPYEKIALRKAKRERLLEKQNKAGIDTTGFKLIQNPYRMFSKPVLDVRTSLGWRNADKEFISNTDISGKSDLLGFSADYGLGFDYQDGKFETPDVLRMTLTRRAFDEPMPLGIREVKLGDVSAPTPTLIRGSNSGRGMSISSVPISRTGVFDEIIIEGVAEPGWEVELYRGNELLEFGNVGESGIYRFENVQLLTGGNNMRVLLHGPEGQLIEREENYSIGNLLAPGTFEYNASIVDTEKATLEIDSDDLRSGTGRRDDQGFAYSGLARLGINRWLSLFATGSNAATRMGKRKYATAGADVSVGNMRASVEGYKELGAGHAVDARLATAVLGWRANLKTQFLNDFESDAAGFGDTAKIFDFDGSLARSYMTDFARFSLRGSANYEKLKDETTTTRYRLNTGMAMRSHSYGNRLTARYQDSHLLDIDGLFNARHRFGRKLSLRSRLGYDVWPEFDFQDVSADLDYRHSKDLNARLTVGQSLQTSRTTVGTNLSYDFKKFLGSLSSRWTRGQGFDFTVRASTSLAPYGVNDSYIASSQSLKNKAGLNSRLFLDRNLNSVYDEGDMPIEEAIVMIDRQESAESDEEGFSHNVSRGKGEYAALTLNKESVDNPFYDSYFPGYEILLRPGVSQQVDFAVVETGVIDGRAYFENGNPVPGLRLQLVNGEGEVLQEVLTFFDGYYSFEFVKPGSYIVRADPSMDVNVPPRIITISTDALFAYGANVKMLEKGGLAPSEIEVDNNKVRQNVAPILAKLVQLQSKLRSAADGT